MKPTKRQGHYQGDYQGRARPPKPSDITFLIRYRANTNNQIITNVTMTAVTMTAIGRESNRKMGRL
jgi:hypothetical protein